MFSNILKWVFRKFDNLKALLLISQTITTITQSGETTEEWLALALKSVHIPCNLLSPSSAEQLNISQKAATL
jgi:hypothetical protein